jgi:endoglycosylceramidase
VLERPYPQAIAGTPTGFSYDTGSDVFQLSYSTSRASGGGAFPAASETDVYVPAQHYRAGYSVQASGAAPISAAGASVLRLATCAGATSVSVRVAPSGASSSDCTRPAAAR